MILVLCCVFLSAQKTNINNFEISPYAGLSSPLGNLNDFAKSGFTWGLSSDYFFGKYFGVGFDINQQINDYKNSPFDFSRIPTDPSYSISNYENGIWQNTTIGIGPVLRLGNEKLSADIYSKAGISIVNTPQYESYFNFSGMQRSLLYLNNPERINSFGLILGIRLNYQISDNLSLFINPLYVYSAAKVDYTYQNFDNAFQEIQGQTIFNPETLIEQPEISEQIQLSNFNLNFGLRFTFGGQKEPVQPSPSEVNYNCGQFVNNGVQLSIQWPVGNVQDRTITCDETITIANGANVEITNPNFFCIDGSGGELVYDLFLDNALISSNQPVSNLNSYHFTNCGLYKVNLKGLCPDSIGNIVECAECPLFFNVECENDPDCCTGSSWGKTYWNGSLVQLNSTLPGIVNCEETQSLRFDYYCNPQSCTPNNPTIEYIVQDLSNNVISTTTGNSGQDIIVPMPNTSGWYNLVVNAYCNGSICNTTTIRFQVNCQQTNCCEGSSWGKRQWATINKFIYNCDTTLSNVFPINSQQVLKYQFICNPQGNCPAQIRYDIVNSLGQVVISESADSGANTTITMPDEAGNYSLIAYGICGGTVCGSCKVNFKVTCEKCDGVSVTKTTQHQTTKTIISGTISGASSSNPMVKVSAELVSYSASRMPNTNYPPVPNFEFTSFSKFNGSPVSLPFSLTGLRSNFIIKDFSNSPITASSFPYYFVIDNMHKKILKTYKIKLMLYFADGTYCESYITNLLSGPGPQSPSSKN